MMEDFKKKFSQDQQTNYREFLEVFYYRPGSNYEGFVCIKYCIKDSTDQSSWTSEEYFIKDHKTDHSGLLKNILLRDKTNERGFVKNVF